LLDHLSLCQQLKDESRGCPVRGRAPAPTRLPARRHGPQPPGRGCSSFARGPPRADGSEEGVEGKRRCGWGMEPFARQMQSSLSLGEHVCMTPVDGVNMTVRVDGVGKGFEVEWRDVRSLPSSSDADVSRNATPRAHSEAIRSVQGLLKVVLKIVFGDESGGASTGGSALSAAGAEAGMVLHLQRRTDRAAMQRVDIMMDGSGVFSRSVVTNGSLEEVAVDKTPLDLLKRLGELLSPEQDMVLVRPVAWGELPSELWSAALRCLTKKEGRAVACSTSMVHQIVTTPSFIWAPAQLHLSLVSAQDAVRLDSSTHLPVNITEGEVRIGRSRRNDVVLLRDPEVSKKHCRIWRDWRGDVYIQDLASTNGTKLNGDWLRPQGDTGPDSRSPSDPRKLTVGDVVVLGLTTLKLDDGPAPDIPKPSREEEGAPGRAASPNSMEGDAPEAPRPDGEAGPGQGGGAMVP